MIPLGHSLVCVGVGGGVLVCVWVCERVWGCVDASEGMGSLVGQSGSYLHSTHCAPIRLQHFVT